jgi:hypothetical protein
VKAWGRPRETMARQARGYRDQGFLRPTIPGPEPLLSEELHDPAELTPF